MRDELEICKTCANFKRGKWHPAFGGDLQYSGKCEVLLSILSMENSKLWNMSDLTVQDTFGCVMWCNNKTTTKVGES